MMWSNLFSRYIAANYSYHEVTKEHWERWLQEAEKHHPWKWSDTNWVDWLSKDQPPLAYMVVP